ncbi:MAG: hypothetical protein PHY79_00570 [Anaerolineae bacterium]|jgi:hypothetical protein|nr:hypothetical protein [Anaerolineae bacterium]MDX9828902.1 hypothetical protein [Anaerolineae bacterium]
MMATILLLFALLEGNSTHASLPQWDDQVSWPAAAVAPLALDFRGTGGPAVAASQTISYHVFLPLTVAQPSDCAPIPGVEYRTLEVGGDPTDRPAEQHADLNLALRGYEPTTAYLGLVDYDGHDDSRAPQLHTLFLDARVPVFARAYRVYDWDWDCNCRAGLLAYPEVTLAGMAVTPGEVLRLPDSGYDIGGGFEALVLYAAEDRITLKYTCEDNVVRGYTIHVEGVCVEPRLLALYREWNAAGRGRLPALRGLQPFGRAMGGEVGVAIRDTGTFMDPRARQSWWEARWAPARRVD